MPVQNWAGLNRTKTAVATPTVTAGAYSANDAVGGLLTFSDIGGPAGGGILQSVVIVDKGNQAIEADLVLFNQTFTATADNAAFDPSDADLLNCVGVITIDTYKQFNDNAVGILAGIGLAFKCATTTTDLYGQLVTRGTPTYTSTSDIQVRITVLQD